MDAALAGLLGASIGAIAGVLGGFITAWQQRQGEVLRWRQARTDEIWREERQSLVDLTNLLAEGSQAVAWFAWAATAKPIEAVKADAHEYDTKMRALLPRLFSAQAVAAGLSDTAYDHIEQLVDRLVSLDTKLGTLSVKLDGEEARTALPQLALFVGPAWALTEDIKVRVRKILRGDRAGVPDSAGSTELGTELSGG